MLLVEVENKYYRICRHSTQPASKRKWIEINWKF